MAQKNHWSSFKSLEKSLNGKEITRKITEWLTKITIWQRNITDWKINHKKNH